jgi:hypothetical protein
MEMKIAFGLWNWFASSLSATVASHNQKDQKHWYPFCLNHENESDLIHSYLNIQQPLNVRKQALNDSIYMMVVHALVNDTPTA